MPRSECHVTRRTHRARRSSWTDPIVQQTQMVGSGSGSSRDRAATTSVAVGGIGEQTPSRGQSPSHRIRTAHRKVRPGERRRPSSRTLRHDDSGVLRGRAGVDGRTRCGWIRGIAAYRGQAAVGVRRPRPRRSQARCALHRRVGLATRRMSGSQGRRRRLAAPFRRSVAAPRSAGRPAAPRSRGRTAR